MNYGITARSYDLLFRLDHVYMIGEVTHLGGLSGLSGRVTLSAEEAICQVNVSRVTRLVEVAFMLLLRGYKLYVNAGYFRPQLGGLPDQPGVQTLIYPFSFCAGYRSRW